MAPGRSEERERLLRQEADLEAEIAQLERAIRELRAMGVVDGSHREAGGMTGITIDRFLGVLTGPRASALRRFHETHIGMFGQARGSSSNHQAWEGGYEDHLVQVLSYACWNYEMMRRTFGVEFDFGLDSVIFVSYFHDVEKMFKYSRVGLPEGWDKETFLLETLQNDWGIEFTAEERNALKYAHGEGCDYRKDVRVMGRLAAILHAADVLSARGSFDLTLNQAK
jgi:hypothetical protein